MVCVSPKEFVASGASGQTVCSGMLLAIRGTLYGPLPAFQGQGFYAHRWIVTDEVIVGQGFFENAPKGNLFGIPSYGRPIFLPMSLWIYFEDGLLKGEAA